MCLQSLEYICAPRKLCFNNLFKHPAWVASSHWRSLYFDSRSTGQSQIQNLKDERGVAFKKVGLCRVEMVTLADLKTVSRRVLMGLPK